MLKYKHNTLAHEGKNQVFVKMCAIHLFCSSLETQTIIKYCYSFPPYPPFLGCTYFISPLGAAVSPHRPCEDPPPAPPPLPLLSLLHAAAFRKRKRECWLVCFQKSLTTLTAGRQTAEKHDGKFTEPLPGTEVDAAYLSVIPSLTRICDCF